MSNERSAVLGVGVLGSMVFGSADGSLPLVTDRTAEDVARVRALRAKGWANMTAAEKAEYSGSMKGAYNHTDMNRVESAVGQITADMNALPVDLKKYAAEKETAWDALFDVPYSYPIELRTKVWARDEIPSDEELARYIENVRKLRFSMDYTAPNLPTSMDRLTYTAANAIEQALVNLDKTIQSIRAELKKRVDNTAISFVYCGEIYGGEL